MSLKFVTFFTIVATCVAMAFTETGQRLGSEACSLAAAVWPAPPEEFVIRQVILSDLPVDDDFMKRQELIIDIAGDGVPELLGMKIITTDRDHCPDDYQVTPISAEKGRLVVLVTGPKDAGHLQVELSYAFSRRETVPGPIEFVHSLIRSEDLPPNARLFHQF